MECNIVSPIGYTGYGVVGRNLVCSLLRSDVIVSLFPIGPSEFPLRQKDLIELAKNNAKYFFKDSPCLRIWHQNDMSSFVGYPRIGYTFFELNKLKPDEIHHLKQVDHLLVASKWAVDVLKRYDIHADVLPCGVDTNIFFPNQIKQRQSKCIFFNAGKFEVRKGHLELAQAFELAFKDNDEVELWLCCDNRFYKNNENNWWKQYFREFCGNRVKFIPWQDTDGQIAKIMRQVSVGVFPAKAEGWNLELLETMSCGIPCIATNYSGHTEFCTSDNCDLIPITKLEPAIDKCPCHPNGFWFNGFGEWASVDINILAEFMVSAYNKWKDGYVNVAGIETGKKYDWSNVANILIERLKQWN